MNQRFQLPAIALCLTALCAQAAGQTPSGKTAAPGAGKQGKSAAGARASVDPLARERRATALALATALAEEARSFRDEQLRARVLARTADALWDTETERARSLFRRAWDAAETADRESLKRLEEQRGTSAARDPGFTGNASHLRSEVLNLAARHDRALAEEFIAKTIAATEEPFTVSAGPGGGTIELATPDPENPPMAVLARLDLATRFLDESDIEHSLQFADKGLERVTSYGITYLSRLREKNQAAADQRFAALLVRSANDPASDATTVSLLSSYAFTPFLYVIARRDGQNHTSQQRDKIVAPVMQRELLAAFFRASAQILLRPLLPPDQDRTLAGRPGLYFTIARLLPLFEQHAADYAPELRAQLGALTPDAPEQFRNGQSSMLTRGLVPEETMKDEGQEALDNLDRAPNGEARDMLYARAALSAARKGDARARDYVDKIDDADLRKQARAYVDFTLVGRAVEKKDTTEALRLARTGELTNVQRAYALLEIAHLLAKTDPTRAAELLDEALAEARRIGGGDADRPRSLFGVATRFYELDRNRAWEALSEALKAANSNNEFTGEDAEIVSRFITKRGSSTTNFTVDIFDLNLIFSLLAKDDLTRAVELSKSFTNEAPRSVAMLSIVRAVLAQKPSERRIVSDQQEIRND
ncbi:MAG: hypothetical protein QOF02_3091 [Blastocatellia bacterium]|jgi:hypothetical protein|nr:hypothetical protein [Blastocatellia bacterium]